MRSAHSTLLMLTTVAACYDGRAVDSFAPLPGAPYEESGVMEDAESTSSSSGGEASSEATSGGAEEDGVMGTSSGEETGEGSTGATTGAGELTPCERCGCHAWSARLPAPQGLRGVDVTALPDGGVLVTTTTDAGLWLYRFATDGALQWSHEFTGQVANARAVAMGAVYVMIAGTVTGPLDVLAEGEGGGADGFVIQFDSKKGVQAWGHRFGDAADQRVGDIAVTGCNQDLTGCTLQLAGVHDGTLGLGAEEGSGETSVFYSRMDALAWDPGAAQTWRIASEPTDDEEMPALATTVDGTTTLVATVVDEDPGDIVLRRVDVEGAVLRERRFMLPGEQRATSAAEAGDSLWISGYVHASTDLGAGPFGGDVGATFIAVMGADGAARASQTVPGRLPTRQALAVTASGTVVMTGSTQAKIDLGGGVLEFKGGRDVMIARHDAAGGFLCGALYGDADVQEGLAAASYGARSFVLARVAGAIDFGEALQTVETELVLAAFDG